MLREHGTHSAPHQVTHLCIYATLPVVQRTCSLYARLASMMYLYCGLQHLSSITGTCVLLTSTESRLDDQGGKEGEDGGGGG